MLEKIITQSVYNNMLGKFYIIFEPLTLFIWCMSNVSSDLGNPICPVSYWKLKVQWWEKYSAFNSFATAQGDFVHPWSIPAFLNLYRGCDQVI